MRTTTDDSRTPTPHGERTRISANIQSSIYRAARSEAAAGGMSLDDFIVLTLEEAASWDPQTRTSIFAAGISRERNETAIHQSISWPLSTQEKVDRARRADWIDAGLPLLRSRWINLSLDAHLAGGLDKAPRKSIVPPYPQPIREDMVLNPKRYGITLDRSGHVPSKPPRDALTVRIDPTITSVAIRKVKEAGTSLRDWMERAITAMAGDPTTDDQKAATHKLLEYHGLTLAEDGTIS